MGLLEFFHVIDLIQEGTARFFWIMLLTAAMIVGMIWLAVYIWRSPDGGEV